MATVLSLLTALMDFTAVITRCNTYVKPWAAFRLWILNRLPESRVYKEYIIKKSLWLLSIKSKSFSKGQEGEGSGRNTLLPHTPAAAVRVLSEEQWAVLQDGAAPHAVPMGRRAAPRGAASHHQVLQCAALCARLPSALCDSRFSSRAQVCVFPKALTEVENPLIVKEKLRAFLSTSSTSAAAAHVSDPLPPIFFISWHIGSAWPGCSQSQWKTPSASKQEGIQP